MNNKGFTLVELLISMVLGLVVLAGVTYIYVAVISSSAATLKSSKLNTQLMIVMSVITNDIRRAGYWSETDELASANPFNVEDDSALVVVDSMSSNLPIKNNTDKDGECLLYSYDLNENQELDSDSEYFGIRLNSGAIEMRTASEVTDGDNCNNGSWEQLTDRDLYTITSLSFNPVGSSCINNSEPDGTDNDGANGIDDDGERDCYSITPDANDITVETREIRISMGATLVSDSNVSYSLSETIRVRNDLVRVR